MLNSEIRSCLSESNRHIEDIIDARKKCGDYDICSRSDNTLNWNYIYSGPGCNEERFVHFDDSVAWNNDSDNAFNNLFSIGPTDSEITVVRVKREGLQFKRSINGWDLHDDAIPGDGTHLGESPSLVNLVTLISHSTQSFRATYEANEYLVPLSSWDPCDKPHEYPDIQATMEATRSLQIPQSENPPVEMPDDDLQIIKAAPNQIQRRQSLAGRISKFIRKHCSINSKSVAESE